MSYQPCLVFHPSRGVLAKEALYHTSMTYHMEFKCIKTLVTTFRYSNPITWQGLGVTPQKTGQGGTPTVQDPLGIA